MLKYLTLIPAELLTLLDLYAEDAYGFRLLKMDFTTDNPVISIAVDVTPDEGERYTQLWDITVSGYVEGGFSSRFFDDLYCEKQHPLLWKYQPEQGELFFSGKVADVPALFLDLWQVHREETREWLAFEKFIWPSIPASLQRGGGSLAKGPVRLLQAYADCLDIHGVGWSMLPGQRHSQPLKALIMGRDYMIAEDFDFYKVP